MALDGFVDRADRVLALIEGFMPEAEWLDDGETLTYLHACISTHRQRVRVPETPMYLDAILADEDLTGGLEPRLGNAHPLRHRQRTELPWVCWRLQFLRSWSHHGQYCKQIFPGGSRPRGADGFGSLSRRLALGGGVVYRRQDRLLGPHPARVGEES